MTCAQVPADVARQHLAVVLPQGMLPPIGQAREICLSPGMHLVVAIAGQEAIAYDVRVAAQIVWKRLEIVPPQASVPLTLRQIGFPWENVCLQFTGLKAGGTEFDRPVRDVAIKAPAPTARVSTLAVEVVARDGECATLCRILVRQELLACLTIWPVSGVHWMALE